MNVSAFSTSVERGKSTFSRFQPANIQQIINVEKFFFSILEAERLFCLIFGRWPLLEKQAFKPLLWHENGGLNVFDVIKGLEGLKNCECGVSVWLISRRHS